MLTAEEQANPEPADISTARRRHERLQVELDRMLAAIRAGMDPALAATQTRAIQAELAAAKSATHKWDHSNQQAPALSELEVRNALTQAGGLIKIVAGADRTDRAALYRALGITVRYQKETATGQELIHVRSQLTSSGGRI